MLLFKFLNTLVPTLFRCPTKVFWLKLGYFPCFYTGRFILFKLQGTEEIGTMEIRFLYFNRIP